MEVEIWKIVSGYERYEVSNFGRVKSLNYKNTGEARLMKGHVNEDGYTMIHLTGSDGKSKVIGVHVLVAMAFVDGYREGLEVSHIDETRQNNRADNLEWKTHKENLNMPLYRKRNSEARKGRKLSDETRAKMSAAQMGNKKWCGKHHTPETRAKMSAAQKGKKLSAEARAKLSAAKMGNKNRCGKHHTPESRAKMSASQKRRFNKE